MKKVVKIAAIVVAVIIVLLIALPFMFRGKIAELVKTEGNKMLNAEFDFASLDISLIRHFPQASLSLEDFWLKGKGDFANDTLVQAGEVTATVNLLSLFGNSGYDISRIYIDDTRLHAIVLEDGRANWDIMKADSTTTDTAATEEGSGNFRIKLQRVELDGVDLIYDDRQGGHVCRSRRTGAHLPGETSRGERSTLQLKAETDGVTYRTGGVPFLNKARITARLDVDADFTNGRYELKDNALTLNAIEANLDGWVQLGEGKTDMDIKLHTNDIGFKEVLSLVPAIYAKDFDQLKTDGTATLSALCQRLAPRRQCACVQSRPHGEGRHVPISVSPRRTWTKSTYRPAWENPGGLLDGTTVTIQPFSFRLANNPFSLTATGQDTHQRPGFHTHSPRHARPKQSPKMSIRWKNMELNGVVKADMNVAGRLSYIEKGEYDNVKAGGTIALSNMKLKMTDLPDINIQKSLFTFTPQYLQLSETTVPHRTKRHHGRQPFRKLHGVCIERLYSARAAAQHQVEPHERERLHVSRHDRDNRCRHDGHRPTDGSRLPAHHPEEHRLHNAGQPERSIV